MSGSVRPATRPHAGTDRPEAGPHRENQLLRELVAVYSHLSGLASQDADMAGVVRLGPGQQPLAAAPADAVQRLEATIGAAALAPVLGAAAQHRRPMSLPGLGAEPGTIAVAPIMVNHDVVAHLVALRPVGPGVP